MKKEKGNIEFEICVMCGELTEMPISLPVDLRKNYVEGLGQLCDKCQHQLNREVKQMYI